MKAEVNRRRVAGVFLLVLGAVTAITVGARAYQAAQDPVQFRPAPNRKSISLPRGQVLLFQFLQSLADATGSSVYYKGSDPPETTIELSRALDTLDSKGAVEILESNGFDLSDADYRGRQVHWVQRSLAPSDQKGKILRGVEKGKNGESGAAKPQEVPREAATAALDAGSSSVSFYALEEGSGSRYLVTLSTSSRKEAEEALSLLKAQRRARTSPPAGR